MRKTVTLLLIMLLLFCSCGEGETDKKILPLSLSVKSASAGEAVVLAENSGDEKIKADGVCLYKIEDGKEIPVGDYEIFYNNELSAHPGETAEWVIDIEELFGEISAGEYKMTFGGFEKGGQYNGNWYKEITFVITEAENFPESLEVKAESLECSNWGFGIRFTNNSDREIKLSAAEEIFYETENGFEKLERIRGTGNYDSVIPVAPGENHDFYRNTEGEYGLFPIGKYRIDLRAVFKDDAGAEKEQIVSGFFEITGFEKDNITLSYNIEDKAEIYGTVIRAEIKNGWGAEVRFGDDYFIQRLEGEEWVTVEPPETPAFDTVLRTVQPGETSEWTADSSLIYGELPKGSYRLCKNFFMDAENYKNGKHLAFFVFEIV